MCELPDLASRDWLSRIGADDGDRWKGAHRLKCSCTDVCLSKAVKQEILPLSRPETDHRNGQMSGKIKSVRLPGDPIATTGGEDAWESQRHTRRLDDMTCKRSKSCVELAFKSGNQVPSHVPQSGY